MAFVQAVVSCRRCLTTAEQPIFSGLFAVSSRRIPAMSSRFDSSRFSMGVPVFELLFSDLKVRKRILSCYF